MENIQHFFPDLSPTQLKQFEMLLPLYNEWNDKINVISRKDMDKFYTHHVLHSLAIAKVIRFKDATSILDVGTGGGFPGIPLAILFPNCQFHLVDSKKKKIKVVNEVVSKLKLSNVKAEWIRAEELNNKYDFIVSRAVTQMPQFIKWVQQKISTNHRNGLPNGILYLKGGDLTEEMKPINSFYEIHPISPFFNDIPFFETKKVVYIQV